MRWDERQLAMLRDMGIRLWLPPGTSPGGDATVSEKVEVSTVGADRLAGDAAREDVAASAASLRQPPDRRPAAGPGESAGRPAPPPAAPPPLVARGPDRLPAGASLATDVATLDWDALRETVSACTACPLSAGRRQTVFGAGHERAEWMIVGEAPGEQEDREGEPFVGKPGQLLDNMLRAVGLTRGEGPPERQVYVANTVKCRPPGNRNPEPAEMARCEPFLARQLELVRPRIILAMGRFAVQSLLLSHEPIGRLRGRLHEYRGVPLVVTFHPAYLLRNPQDKGKAWDDLCLALATLRATPLSAS